MPDQKLILWAGEVDGKLHVILRDRSVWVLQHYDMGPPVWEELPMMPVRSQQ